MVDGQLLARLFVRTDLPPTQRPLTFLQTHATHCSVGRATFVLSPRERCCAGILPGFLVTAQSGCLRVAHTFPVLRSLFQREVKRGGGGVGKKYLKLLPTFCTLTQEIE